MDEEKIRIRGVLLHYWQKDLTAKAAAEEICRVEGERTIHRNTAAKWFARFNDGDYSLSDRSRSGRPRVVDDEALVEKLNDDNHASTRELSAMLGSSQSTINGRLTQLGYVSKRPRQTPHNLTDVQSQKRVDICKQLLQNPLDDRFWRRIITCDEKWIFYYNPDKRRQWVLYDEEAEPVVKQSRFGSKAMVCVWWNFEGVLYFELVSDGRSINADLYSEQLDRVYNILKGQYPAMINRERALLLHDGAPARALLTQAKIEELDGLEILPHSAYSPDLAPSDYGLFRSMATFLRGKRFDKIDDVEKACREFFASKSKEWYRDEIRKLAERWIKVIESNGQYFKE